MKNVKELVYYTHRNLGAMREWYNFEYKYAENLLNKWIKEFRIESKKDNELVYNINAYDLEGGAIFQRYMTALTRCWEQYT